MSYDINFWRQERPLAAPPEDIYAKLCDGEPVPGLRTLPKAEVLARIKQVFPAFDPSESFPLIGTADGSIEVSWSDQHFRFDLHGESESAAQKLADIMREFDCPMYDPQINTRYDADNGMSVGEAPPPLISGCGGDMPGRVDRMNAVSSSTANRPGRTRHIAGGCRCVAVAPESWPRRMGGLWSVEECPSGATATRAPAA